MTKREAINGKPYAGNPHVRFDEGEVATATPRCGSLLYISSVKEKVGIGSLRKLLPMWLQAIVISACCFVNDLHADVYGKAYYWSRGIATDLNENGLLDDAAEVHDSLNLHANVAANVCNPGDGSMSFVDELVWMPYRGVRKMRSCIYFPQTTVITNAVTGDGYLYANSIEFSKEFTSPFSTTDFTFWKDFSVAARFRPDLNRPARFAWLLNFGNAINNGQHFGFLLGFRNVITNSFSGDKLTNYLSEVVVSFPNGKTWETGKHICLNAWNDIVFSVDGERLSMLISRTHPIERTVSQNSAGSKDLLTVIISTNIVNVTTSNPAPHSNGRVVIGGETVDMETQVRMWNAYKADDGRVCHFSTKRFRGSLQSFAIWTNALNEMEMREAAAWPRTDLWRIGVENGSATEFMQDASGDVDVDGDFWNVPQKMCKGDSVTFSFPVNSTGEADMNQLFSVKTIDVSARYNAQVSVNGTQLSQCAVQSGSIRRWFVPSRLLLPGAMNKLTFVMGDSDTNELLIDVFSLGGSLQYGERDGQHEEFGMENKAKEAGFHLVGGNWLDGSRAFYCLNNVNQPSKQIIKFQVPLDICKRNKFRLRFKTRYNSTFTGRITINGTKICDFHPNTEYEVEIPNGVIQVDNTLEWANVTASGTYTSPDFLQLIVQKPSFGTVLLCR